MIKRSKIKNLHLRKPWKAVGHKSPNCSSLPFFIFHGFFRVLDRLENESLPVSAAAVAAATVYFSSRLPKASASRFSRPKLRFPFPAKRCATEIYGVDQTRQFVRGRLSAGNQTDNLSPACHPEFGPLLSLVIGRSTVCTWSGSSSQPFPES